MPDSATFQIPPIRDFVKRYCNGGIVVDPFARNSRVGTITNDLNPATSADFHLDAEEFLKSLADYGVKADVILIDPPYSPRQVKECYDKIGIPMQQHEALLGYTRGRLRDQIARLLGPDGIVLWFGWNTTGMGNKFGFEIVEILLVCHGSDHNDTICFAERRCEPPPILQHGLDFDVAK